MKRFFLLAICAVLASGASAQRRLQIGVRGGVNATDYKAVATRIGDYTFSPGSAQVGYEAGLVVRLNLSRHIHIQSELDYDFVNYQFSARGPASRRIMVRTERLQIPLQLGFQAGILRIFGGAQFRVSQSERSNTPELLKVKFNNDNVGIMGGIGLNVRKFFIDFRVSGYPRTNVWQEFTSDGVTRRVKVPHDIVYGGSIGFFF